MSPLDEKQSKRRRVPPRQPRELQYHFPIFKIQSEMSLGLHLSTPPVWRQTFDLWAEDKRQQWPIRAAGIRLNDIFRKWSWSGNLKLPWPPSANAAESAIPHLSTAPRRSGFILGGYDPIVLSDNIINLLLKYQVISSPEAILIQKEVTAPSAGVSIGSLNVLRFDEVTINVLLSRRVITVKYAEGMLERSRQAPGLQINGYNVIVLKASILQALFESGVVPLKEAQAALDSAKVDG